MNSVSNKRLARNTALLYSRMLLVMLVTLYTTRVILQVLGAEEYGIYNVIAGFVSLFAVLNNCLSTGTNRFYNFALGQNDHVGITKVFNASLRIQIIILLVLFVIIESVGLWYINNKMVLPADRLDVAQLLFQCSVLSLLFVVLQIPYSAAVMAYERMDFYAIISILDSVLKLGIVFIIANVSSYDQLAIYAVLLMLVSACNFLLYFIYCKINFKLLKFSWNLDGDIFKSLLSFSSWSVIDPFSYIVRDQGSNMTLNLFFGTIVNAAYGIAAQVSGAVSSFASNLSIAFRPQIIQAYSSGNNVRAKNLMFSMSKINFILQMCVAIPLVYEMRYVLAMWLGDNVPDYTVVFAAIVVVLNSINCLNEPVSIIMTATGRIKKIKTVSMFIICSVVPIGYVLFTFGYPPYAIFIAMFCLTLLNQCSCVIIMSKEFKAITPQEYFKVIGKPLLLFATLSLIVPGIITSFINPSFLRFVSVFSLSMMSSVAIAYYICMNHSEKEIFKGYVGRVVVKISRRNA